MTSNKQAGLPLSDVKAGIVRMVAASGMNLESRLVGMGIIKGTRMHLIRNDGRGPLVVGVKASRIAIGRGMAQRIIVEPQATPGK